MSFNHATWPVGRKESAIFSNFALRMAILSDLGCTLADFTPYEAERPAKLVPVAEPSRTVPQTDHTCTDHTESDTAPSTT